MAHVVWRGKFYLTLPASAPYKIFSKKNSFRKSPEKPDFCIYFPKKGEYNVSLIPSFLFRLMKTTANRVRELLEYYPDTGELYWKVSGKGYKLGERAGKSSPDGGYRSITIDGIGYPEHRIIYLHQRGFWPYAVIDHINHIRDDNRWCNIRSVTHSTNAQNRCSKDTGLYKKGNSWVARIVIDRIARHIGVFSTKAEARLAYKMAKSIYHPKAWVTVK